MALSLSLSSVSFLSVYSSEYSTLWHKEAFLSQVVGNGIPGFTLRRSFRSLSRSGVKRAPPPLFVSLFVARWGSLGASRRRKVIAPYVCVCKSKSKCQLETDNRKKLIINFLNMLPERELYMCQNLLPECQSLVCPDETCGFCVAVGVGLLFQGK